MDYFKSTIWLYFIRVYALFQCGHFVLVQKRLPLPIPVVKEPFISITPTNRVVCLGRRQQQKAFQIAYLVIVTSAIIVRPLGDLNMMVVLPALVALIVAVPSMIPPVYFEPSGLVMLIIDLSPISYSM